MVCCWIFRICTMSPCFLAHILCLCKTPQVSSLVPKEDHSRPPEGLQQERWISHMRARSVFLFPYHSTPACRTGSCRQSVLPSLWRVERLSVLSTPTCQCSCHRTPHLCRVLLCL